MTINFPYGHLSYASSRLQVFCSLHRGPSSKLLHELTSPCPFDPRNQQRSFRKTTNHFKDGRGRQSTIKNSRRKHAKIFAGRQKLRAQRELNPIFKVHAKDQPQHETSSSSVPEAASQSSLNQAELTAFAESVNGAGGVLNSVEATDDARSWNPYTDEGKNDLKSMIAELESLTENAVEEPRTLKALAQESFAVGQTSINFPVRSFESPIERRIASDKKRKQPKMYIRFQDLDAQLLRNPWVRMISSPVRLDAASKARLPKSLMLGWGLVRDPQGKLDYLMPVDAAELHKLKSEVLSPDAQSNPQTESQSKRGEAPIDGQRIYIQPNSLLVQAITDAVIVKKPNGNKEHDTISRLISSFMIPWRWKGAIARAIAYKGTQVEFDQATGRHVPNFAWKKDVPNFNRVQWQIDVDSRMHTILRERVIIALKGIAIHNKSTNAIRSRKVVAMDVPDNGESMLNVPTVEQDEDTEQREISTDTQDDRRFPKWHPGSIFLHIGTPKQYVAIVKKLDARNQRASKLPSASDYLPPVPDDPLLPPLITLSGENDQTSPLTVRLPVFNLAALLGQSYADQIDSIVSDNGPLDLRFWKSREDRLQDRREARARENDHGTTGSSSIQGSHRDDSLDNGTTVYTNEKSRRDSQAPVQPSKQTSILESREPDQQGKEYIVLVKSTAAKSKELVDEIWQLWRYIEGRKGLWYGDQSRAKATGALNAREGV